MIPIYMYYQTQLCIHFHVFPNGASSPIDEVSHIIVMLVILFLLQCNTKRLPTLISNLDESHNIGIMCQSVTKMPISMHSQVIHHPSTTHPQYRNQPLRHSLRSMQPLRDACVQEIVANVGSRQKGGCMSRGIEAPEPR